LGRIWRRRWAKMSATPLEGCKQKLGKYGNDYKEQSGN
jgi:hypothetical protein